jgi:gamma-tubulin complex component 5
MIMAHAVSGIKQHFLWLIDILYEHMTSTVLAHGSASMRIRLSEAEDIDAMENIHQAYILRLQDQCLLSKNLAPIYQGIISMLALAIKFASLMQTSCDLKSLLFTRKSAHSGHGQRANLCTRRVYPLSTASESDENDGHNQLAEAHDASRAVDTYKEKPEIHQECLETITADLKSSCAFVVAGLRGVSRAGGEHTWEMLAERLDWDQPPQTAKTDV